MCRGGKSDTTGLYWCVCGLTFTNMPINNTIPRGDYKHPGCRMSSGLMLELEMCFFLCVFFFNKYNFHPEGYCIFKSPPKKKNETYSFASSLLLFQYSSLLVPPPHIIKHIIITWLSACVSLRSILALPGNQFVVTLCNPSKVIKWNELQLQRAFKNTGGEREREKKWTREKWQHGPGIFHRLIAHPRSWRWNINAQFVYLQAHISPVPSC